MSDWAGTINGLTVGAGTPYRLVGVSGWQTMGAAPLGGAGSLAPKQTRNGSWPLPYFMASRVVLFAITVEDDTATFQASVDALLAATQPGSDIAVSLQVNGVNTTVTGQVSNRDVPTGLEYPVGYSAASVEVTCPDPRRFGTDVTASTSLPSSTGGLTWPLTFPAVWAATQVSGAVVLVNPGNASGPLRLKILGPCTGPMVTHVSSGQVLEFASDLTVNAGDWLDVDMEAQTVLYNGQASRNGSVTSRGWFGFDPGDNTIAFNASAYNTSARLQVTGTPAWI